MEFRHALRVVPLAAVALAVPAERAAASEPCVVTEVAPGVKMRSAPCSNPFRNPFGPSATTSVPRTAPKRPEGVQPGPTPGFMMYNNVEVRIGGSVRYEMQRSGPVRP